jgi:hypothetical protein
LLRLPAIWMVMLLLVTAVTVSHAATLKEMFDLAGPRDGYDRYIELETGVTYTGGLLIGRTWSWLIHDFQYDEEGLDLRIVGNGAILDLQGQQICVSFSDSRLDISDCIILGGNIRFRGDNNDYPPIGYIPTGSVRQVTFYRPHDYGIRLQGTGAGVELEYNLIVDPIDTGLDCVPFNGVRADLLPSGSCIAGSVQVGDYGFPWIGDNWTYFSDPDANADPIRHHVFLCEYG